MNNEMTIRRAVKHIYNQLPTFFTGMELCENVKIFMIEYGRYPMDGTILRELRRMRADGTLCYKVFDVNKSKYKKINS